MVRRYCSFFLLIVSFFLLVGCTNPFSFTPEDDNDDWWINYSSFEKRFNKLPNGITASSWQTEQQADCTLHSTVLSCNGKQHQHNLEITANNKDKIFDINLQSSTADNINSCFAEIAFHLFCSMGFNDEDGKGNVCFDDANEFYTYFENFSHKQTQKSMWVNRHKVEYTYQTDTKTQRFTINYDML